MRTARGTDSSPRCWLSLCQCFARQHHSSAKRPHPHLPTGLLGKWGAALISAGPGLVVTVHQPCCAPPEVPVPMLRSQAALCPSPRSPFPSSFALTPSLRELADPPAPHSRLDRELIPRISSQLRGQPHHVGGLKPVVWEPLSPGSGRRPAAHRSLPSGPFTHSPSPSRDWFVPWRTLSLREKCTLLRVPWSRGCAGLCWARGSPRLGQKEGGGVM